MGYLPMVPFIHLYQLTGLLATWQNELSVRERQRKKEMVFISIGVSKNRGATVLKIIHRRYKNDCLCSKIYALTNGKNKFDQGYKERIYPGVVRGKRCKS